MHLLPRASIFLTIVAALSAPAEAVEKASDQVNAFYGSFSQAIAIDAPAYHGIEPRVAISYSSEGRNGFAGVGWTLGGIGTIERANAGRGTPHWDSADVFLLNGQELVPCHPGSPSPSCTTGGTHSTKQESYVRIRFDPATNTWAIWGKDGARRVLGSVLTVPPNAVVAGGTLVWGQTSTTDTHGNVVGYTWTCAGGDCYPDAISYAGYQVRFYRESRPDPISAAAASTLRKTLHRLRSVIVQLGTAPIRGYRLSYTSSPLTGRSLLSAVQVYGKDLVHDGNGVIISGTALPAQTFTYQDDAIGKSFASWALPPTGNVTEPVAWGNRVNVATVGNGNGLIKNAGVNGNWDAGATSTRALSSGSGFLEFTATNVYDAGGNGIGLSNGNTDTNWTDIDFGLYLYGSQVYAIEGGTQPNHWPVAEGDVLRVEVTPTSVTYRKNGAVLYTHTASPHYPLLIDSSLRTTNTALSNAHISGSLVYANAWCQGGPFLMGDFNGDGRTDQLCSSYSLSNGQPVNLRLDVALAGPAGFAPRSLWSSAVALVSGRVTVGDFNDDGKADLALQSPDAVISVMLSTGSAFAAPAAWGTAVGPGVNGGLHACNGSTLVTMGTGDFNGDGRTDVSCKRFDDRSVHIGVSNGSSFAFSVWGESGCDVYDLQDSSLDFDGDGKDDWYCIGATNGVLAVLPSSGSAFYGGIAGNLNGTFCASEYYVLGDFNGDGRTDAYCTLNGRIAFSMGRAWAPQTPDSGAWCTASGVDVIGVDVDGDGASEIVCNHNGNGADDIQVRKWKGGVVAPAETWKASWCTGKVRGGDWNGDGKVDLYCDSAADPAVAGTAARQADLMSAARGTLGGTVSVAYTPAVMFPNVRGPFPGYAVTSLSTDDGRGGVATVTSTYSGGRFDPKERMFLGYAYSKQTLPAIGSELSRPYTEMWFRQDLPALGLPEKVAKRDSANAYHAVGTFQYQTNGSALPRTALLTQARAVSFPGSGCSTFPCTEQRSTLTTHQYDAYGNRTQTSFSGDEATSNDESSTAWTYAYNTSAYIVGAVASEKRYGPSTNLLTHSEFLYDNATAATIPPLKGDRTTVRRWLDTESRWLADSKVYDTYGNVTRTTDATGRFSVTTFDGTYHLFPTSTAVGTETTNVAWDPVCTTPTQSTDPNSLVTTFQTDALCRPSRIGYPSGTFETKAYLDLGVPGQQQVTVARPSPTGHGLDLLTSDYLDGFGRPYRATVRPGGMSPILGLVSRELTFDARGNVSTQVAPHTATEPTQVTTFAYDVLNRPRRVTLPDGAVRTTEYAPMTVTSYDEHEHEQVSVSDAYGRPVTSSRKVGGDVATTRYAFDVLGRKTGQADADGNQWSWSYDSLGRVRVRNDPDAGITTYQYDDAGRVVARTDAKGETTTLSYDFAGRISGHLTSLVGPGSAQGEQTTLTYGEARSGYFNVGRLTTIASNAPGLPLVKLDYGVDGANLRRTRTFEGSTYTLLSRFDTGGRLLGLTYPDGDAIGTPTQPFQYDGFGRLRVVPGIIDEVEYDSRSLPIRQFNANGSVVERTYSAERGLLSHVTSRSTAGTFQDQAYPRDQAGLVTGLLDAGAGQAWSLEYDEAHHLISANEMFSPGNSQTFTYDLVGRMTSNSRVGEYVYPFGGNPRPHAPSAVGAETMSYDATGNLVASGSRTYTWGYFDTLASTTSGSTTTAFAYDSDRRRLKMTSPSGTVLWPLGPNYEIANGVATKYLAVPGLGLVAKRVGAQTSWIHTDGLGSVHVLTDVTGTPGPRRTYRPFGETLSGSLDEPRGFVGERLDSDTGLTQMGARYYRADLGIFLSPDPANADLASYAYAYGSPFQFRDPTGLAGEPPEPMRLPGIEVHCPPSGIGDQCPTIGTSPQLWIIMQYVMGIGLFQSRNCNLGYDCPPASIPTGYEWMRPTPPPLTVPGTPPVVEPVDAVQPVQPPAFSMGVAYIDPPLPPEGWLSPVEARSITLGISAGFALPFGGAEEEVGVFWTPEEGDFGLYRSKGFAAGVDFGVDFVLGETTSLRGVDENWMFQPLGVAYQQSYDDDFNVTGRSLAGGPGGLPVAYKGSVSYTEAVGFRQVFDPMYLSAMDYIQGSVTPMFPY